DQRDRPQWRHRARPLRVSRSRRRGPGLRRLLPQRHGRARSSALGHHRRPGPRLDPGEMGRRGVRFPPPLHIRIGHTPPSLSRRRPCGTAAREARKSTREESMSKATVRVAVLGAGRMGADHIERLTRNISGAEVSAVIDTDEARARSARQLAPGSVVLPTLEAAIDANVMDALLIATPGPAHEPAIMLALAAKLPILCEKPLTEDPVSSRRIVEAEQELDRPHIQVGFTRRFDADYIQMRRFIERKRAGELLMLHCVHRNPSVAESYRPEMLIADSVVHEFDAAAWLAGAAIRNVEVRHARTNSVAREDLREPILVLF